MDACQHDNKVIDPRVEQELYHTFWICLDCGHAWGEAWEDC